MSVSQATLRRLAALERRLTRLERCQPATDVGTAEPPPLPSEQLRVVLRMLVEAGGLQGERFAQVRAALAATTVEGELETRGHEYTSGRLAQPAPDV